MEGYYKLILRQIFKNIKFYISNNHYYRNRNNSDILNNRAKEF